MKLVVLAIFTCGISWCVRSAVRQIKAKYINKILLPSAFNNPATLLPLSDPEANTAHIFNRDGLKLDAMEIEINSSSKKWLVYFAGNGGVLPRFFDDLKLKEFAKKVDANLLVFNYRGVGNSEGRPVSFKDLLIDGAACVDYLKQKKNIDEKNIALWGFSLGGAIASILGSYYDKIKVFNERSFNSSIKAIYHLLGGGFFGACGVIIVVLSGSHVNVGKYWRNISKKRKILAYHAYDGVIKKPASLYLGEKRRVIKAHPEYLRQVGSKMKLLQHKKPAHIKIDAGNKVISSNNHIVMNAENATKITQALTRLFKR